MQYHRTEDIIRYTVKKTNSSEEVLQPVEVVGASCNVQYQQKNWLFMPIVESPKNVIYLAKDKIYVSPSYKPLSKNEELII